MGSSAGVSALGCSFVIFPRHFDVSNGSSASTGFRSSSYFAT